MLPLGTFFYLTDKKKWYLQNVFLLFCAFGKNSVGATGGNLLGA